MPSNKKLPKSMWAIVQHSAFGYNTDWTFKQGLEVREIDKQDTLLRIVRLGGLVFPDYGSAEDYTMYEMYGEAEGLVPKAPGTFSWYEVDGLKIYLPKTKIDPHIWKRPEPVKVARLVPIHQPNNPDLWR